MLSPSMYLLLRQRGRILISADEAGSIPGVRRHARRDGLLVEASRGPRKGLSPSQARQRPYTLCLMHPDDPTTIYCPDAQEA